MSKIQIDLDTNSTKADAAVAGLERRFEELSKSMQQQNREASKAAKVATGSYQALEKELKDNVRELKRMEIGSKAFDVQRQKVAGLERQLSSARGQMKAGTTAAQGLRSAASGAVRNVAGIAAGILSVKGALAAVVQELEKAKSLELKAVRQELTLEAALAQIGLNVGGDQVGTARAMVEANAQGLGTTQEGLANLLGVAISAGAKDLEEAMSVSAAALKATVGDATLASELAQTALDIASLSGSQNFEGALGQVAQVQSQVRSVNAQEFFTNIGPALAAAAADRANIDGISTERALEISAVFSQVLKDRTGANTATAVRQFVTRLDAFVPELSTTLKDGSVSTLTQEQIDEFRGARTIDERVDQFRSNEALRRQFLDQQKEGIGKGAIFEFIGGTELASGFEAKAAAAITSLNDGVKSFKTLVDGVSDATGLLGAERTSKANIEALQTTSVRAQSMGAVRNLLTDTMESVNLPGFDALESRLAGFELSRLRDDQDPVQFARMLFQALASGERSAEGERTLSTKEVAFIEKQLEVLSRIERHLVKRANVTIEAPPQGPRPIQPAAVNAP